MSAMARIIETMRVELESRGVRVLTSICGFTDRPMFGKSGGPVDLPKDSYHHYIENAAWKKRMAHYQQAVNVEVLAIKLVRRIVGGARGII